MEHYVFLKRLFDFADFKVQEASTYSTIFTTIFSIASIICGAFSYFAENILGISAMLLLFLFVIMITDYITGLSASKKEGQKFTSKKGTGWVFKLGSYLVYLWGVNCFVEHLVSKNLDIFTYPVFILHIYMIIHILLWETKSIDENLERLGYNFKILKIFDNIFTIFKNTLQKKIKE